jgi:3-isopropylmalate/(R)-2-methylmalate dehydratase large subunit
MGQTITEKIFSAHVGRPVHAEEVVVSPVDFVFSHDGNRPQPHQTFLELGGDRVFDPAKVAMFLDHAPNVHTAAVAQMHQKMRTFAEDQGIALFEIGRGISHQVLPEEGLAVPGWLMVGSDSHSCTGGAFNLLSTGVGAADLAVAMMLGKSWFRVPQTVRVVANGQLGPGVHAKDLALHLLGQMSVVGATYRTLEVVGEAISALSMHERMTITNMTVEMGAKFGVMEADATTAEFLGRHGVSEFDTYVSDRDANFLEVHDIDASTLEPQVATPPSPDLVVPVGEAAGTRIEQATVGTSSNGQLDDLRVAARLLAGHRVAPHVRLFVVPASRRAFLEAMQEGLIETMLAAGAILGTPGCSGCTGSSGFGVPSDGENMITSAPRNFIGRTGNRNASIYLASPATVIASAVAGEIADPRELMTEVG